MLQIPTIIDTIEIVRKKERAELRGSARIGLKALFPMHPGPR